MDSVYAADLGDNSCIYFPQLFFAKRVSLEHDDSRVSASATTRARLRDGFPELDLLFFDPGYLSHDWHMARV